METQSKTVGEFYFVDVAFEQSVFYDELTSQLSLS